MSPHLKVSLSPSVAPALVYLPSTPSSARLSVVFGLHAGGLFAGSADEMPWWLIEEGKKHQWAIVSLPYRLLLGGHNAVGGAAGCLNDVVSQIDAALGGELQKGLKEQGSEFEVDTSKFGIVGFSAGGTLTLLTAPAVTPKPAFAIALYPPVQLTSPFYSTLNRSTSFVHPLKLSSFFKSNSIKQIEGLWNGPVLTETPRADVAFQESDDPAAVGHPGMIWDWSLGEGILPELFIGGRGFDSNGDVIPVPKDLVAKEIQNVLPLATPGLDLKTFPPTWIVHGTKDTLVPVEDGEFVKTSLEGAGVECHFTPVEGVDHGFDAELTSGNLVDWSAIGGWAAKKLA